MAAARHHVSDGAEVWLGVHDASTMLGVSSATLRRWSAAGKIEAFTTPGGHRRYARSMIQQLLHRSAGGEASVSELGESPVRMAGIVQGHVATACSGISWLGAADEETRRLLALSGFVMVDGLLGYIDAASPRDEDAAIRPAEEAAALHGRIAARHRGDLCETVAAFHRFRDLLIDDISELACQRGLGTSETTRILARANSGVDRLVVALVAAHGAAAEAAAAAG